MHVPLGLVNRGNVTDRHLSAAVFQKLRESPHVATVDNLSKDTRVFVLVVDEFAIVRRCSELRLDLLSDGVNEFVLAFLIDQYVIWRDTDLAVVAAVGASWEGRFECVRARERITFDCGGSKEEGERRMGVDDEERQKTQGECACKSAAPSRETEHYPRTNKIC